MAQYELFSSGKYRYTLGTDEDPREALEAEQGRGGRRLSITKVESGKRTPNWLTSDEPVRNTEDEEEEEDFQEYA